MNILRMVALNILLASILVLGWGCGMKTNPATRTTGQSGMQSNNVSLNQGQTQNNSPSQSQSQSSKPQCTYYGTLASNDSLDSNEWNVKVNDLNCSGQYTFVVEKYKILGTLGSNGTPALGEKELVDYSTLVASDGRLQRTNFYDTVKNRPGVKMAIAGESGAGNGDYGAMYTITIIPKD